MSEPTTGTAAPLRPLPAPDRFSGEYWSAARDHRLRIQRCRACHRFNHAPSLTCPSCGSEDLAYEDVSGTGTLYSYTVVIEPPAPGFAHLVPLVVAVVELTEQPRLFLTTNLVDAEAEEIRIGMPVEVVFDDIAPDCALPQFRPAKGTL